MRVLAVDPGGTVGWAVGGTEWRGGAGGVSCGQFKREEAVARWTEFAVGGPDVCAVMELLKLYRKHRCGVLVMEDWQARPGSVLKGGAVVLSPLAQQAMVRFAFAHKWTSDRITLQTAGQAKGVLTDDRLRALGVYPMTVGLPHARDAMRHLLLFIRRVANGEVVIRET